MIDPQTQWLLLEGIIPLLGAGVLYLLWGAFRYITTDDKATFTYGWREAADPLGWLYGAVIIAVQSALKCASNSGPNLLFWMCVAGGFACLLLLVAAMNDRGAKTTWKPPASLQVAALILVMAIVYAGFEVRVSSAAGVVP